MANLSHLIPFGRFYSSSQYSVAFGPHPIELIKSSPFNQYSTVVLGRYRAGLRRSVQDFGRAPTGFNPA